MRLIFLTLFFAIGSLHSEQILLDDVMTKKEQRKIGINKLSRSQKIRLEKWINGTFVLKENNLAQTPNLYLSINIDSGSQLELSDNSLWEVDPDDRNISSVWLTPFPVQISPSGDPSYPFRITNRTNHDSVKARKIAP